MMPTDQVLRRPLSFPLYLLLVWDWVSSMTAIVLVFLIALLAWRGQAIRERSPRGLLVTQHGEKVGTRGAESLRDDGLMYSKKWRQVCCCLEGRACRRYSSHPSLPTFRFSLPAAPKCLSTAKHGGLNWSNRIFWYLSSDVIKFMTVLPGGLDNVPRCVREDNSSYLCTMYYVLCHPAHLTGHA